MDEFVSLVWDYYTDNRRDMPWRDDPSFYNVLVSELMLQQTQVPRVMPKFESFMVRFPTISALAGASLAEVLQEWQGLGYNRRAKYLHEAAKMIAAHGEPTTQEGLVRLPGVGPNTAAAIMNYAYNVPVPFVETNIRTVYFHFFFQDKSAVSDAEILEQVANTISHDDPREWFWALMDYGSYLKSQGQGRLDVSSHYVRQSPFKGSVRQVRGQIIKALSADDLPLDALQRAVGADNRFTTALNGLVKDGLIQVTNDRYHLTKR